MPRKLLVGGVQRNNSSKGAVTIKKVSPPTVPTISVKGAASHLKQRSSPCVCADQLTLDLGEAIFDGSDLLGPPYAKPPRSSSIGNGNSFYSSSFHQSLSMKKMTPGGGSSGQIHLAHVIVHSQPDSLPSSPSDTCNSPSLTKGRLMSGTQASLEDQGIDLNSPGRHSPGGSSGSGSSISRHSLSSLDSGRASAPGNEGKAVNRRLSIQSYEGSSPQRRSYHSSSSSIASVGEEPAIGQGPNVAEMVLHGLPDVEILSNWLASLHFEEYIQLFLLAGYDMPTITRMTPEDLTAIGITKPNHRRKLKSEMAKLKISDGIPEYKPNSLLEWLQLLRLEEYFDTLCQQNFNTIDKVTDLTWEDLEDIGIQKLGHQKKILLAIKRIEDINQGRRPNLYPQMSYQNNSNAMNSGSATFPRPSTLNNVQPYHYPSQEIAIAMHRPKSSPSTDSIPEMKTFQQSPVREESFLPQPNYNSTQHNSLTSQSQSSYTSMQQNNMQSQSAYNSMPHNSMMTLPQTVYNSTQHNSMSAETQAAYNSTQYNSMTADTQAVYNSAQYNSMTADTQAMYNSAQYNSMTSQPQSTFNSTMHNSVTSQLACNSTQNSMTAHPQTAFSSTQNSAQQQYSSQHNGRIGNPVLSPCRGRSLESLSSENPPLLAAAPSPPPPAPSYTPAKTVASEPPKVPPRKDWQVTDLDTDYECEGTATLNRPKGLVKLRPVAKITAKTREEIAEAIMDIPDKEFKSLIDQSRVLDGWSSLDGSPRHGPSTVPRASGTLKRAPPPPPPKRSNSAKADRVPLEPPPRAGKEDTSATKPKVEPKPSTKPQDDDYPPPPSPLPTAMDDKAKDELFSNPLFRQRRKDSAGSSNADSSTALPFANEAISTIKQKPSRAHPGLPVESSKVSSQRRELNSQKGRKVSENHSSANQEHEYDITPEAISPGDVIDDIENMLANLSDQLDAMLDSEQVQK